ncbi:hypothetical protein BJ508DRAFT_315328, partial [Ascobolus immersus RN42]
FGKGRKGVGSVWRDSYKAVKIVGTFKPNPNRERSASRIQYLDYPLAEPVRNPDSHFAEVLFFLSVEDPLDLFDKARLEGKDESIGDCKELILAVVHDIPVEYTSDKVLLRVAEGTDKKNKKKNCQIIDAKCIHGLIGLLTSEGRKYLTWEDNCWSTIGGHVDI